MKRTTLLAAAAVLAALIALPAAPVTASPSSGTNPNVIASIADAAQTEAEDAPQPGCYLCYLPALYSSDVQVTVAIIDTGVDPHHEAFVDQLVPGENFVKEGDLGPVRWADGNGHGTHVAGVVLSVAPTAKILPVRVVDRAGSGSAAEIAEGIRWATDRGARVLNISLGVDDEEQRAHPELLDAVRYARSRDVVVVAAAGNEAEIGSPASYPAAWDETIAVGSVEGEQVADYSNRGAYVDLVTQGSEVRSTALGGGYVTMSGTSMASPRVAGAAAVLRTLHPEWSASDVYDQLAQTATDLGPQGRDATFGWGALDIRRAAQVQLTRPTGAVPELRKTKVNITARVGGVRVTARTLPVIFIETHDGAVYTLGDGDDFFSSPNRQWVRIWGYDTWGAPTEAIRVRLRPKAAPPIRAQVIRRAGVVSIRFTQAPAPGTQIAVYASRSAATASYIDGSAVRYSFRSRAEKVRLCWSTGLEEHGCRNFPVRRS